MNNDRSMYISIWSLIISYVIFIFCLFVWIPKWLFVFAACCLTTTSILGTFFITIPLVDEANKDNDGNKRNKKIILNDFYVHSGPFLLFLILYPFLRKSATGKEDYPKIAISLFAFVVSYILYTHAENVYYYDYISLAILSLCMFTASLKVYV
jgi:hypothetical protein